MNLLDHLYILLLAVSFSKKEDTHLGAIGLFTIILVIELIYKTWFM